MPLVDIDTTTPPYLRQDIYTTADTNGNSRACRIIYSQEGKVLDVMTRYGGWPSWTFDLFPLEKINVRPREYRQILRLETARWRQ